MIDLPAQSGEVYRYPGNDRRFVVVLTGSTYNQNTRRPIVCPLVLTEDIITPVAADPLHTITPSPGFIAYPLRFWLPDSALAAFIGDVEQHPLRRAQHAAIDGYR